MYTYDKDLETKENKIESKDTLEPHTMLLWRDDFASHFFAINRCSALD